MNDRVFEYKGEWRFWDETDAHMIVPYRERDEAADKMAEYGAMLNRRSVYENRPQDTQSAQRKDDRAAW